MQIAQQILFILLFIVAVWLFVKKVNFISRNIKLGRKEDFTPDPNRWKNVLLIAFGQKRMFDKPLVALLHFAVYAGFFLIALDWTAYTRQSLQGVNRYSGKLNPWLKK